MREILFRGIDFLTGKWVQGDLLHISSGCIIYHGSQTESEIKENTGAAIELFINEISVVKPKTVGQFTGLTDKNGVKIFEGDIVRYYQPYSQKWEEHIVLWDINWASFGLFEKGSAYCKESDWVKIQHIEIIGNIHDNKELIKE